MDTQWLEVRHLPPTSTLWFAGNDDLAGTNASFGDPNNSSVEWNIKFDTFTWDKYLFAYGNLKWWGIMNKSTVNACDAAGWSFTFEKSSHSANPNTGIANCGSSSLEPSIWISKDTSAFVPLVGLYVEESCGGDTVQYLANNGGISVYINYLSNTTCTTNSPSAYFEFPAKYNYTS
jgi:hypothetical protein